jgi:hypothetical protein
VSSHADVLEDDGRSFLVVILEEYCLPFCTQACLLTRLLNELNQSSAASLLSFFVVLIEK